MAAKKQKPKKPIIYKTFSDEKELKKYLTKIKKASPKNRYEIKFRQKDGKIKKFRMGKKRDEVIARAKLYVNTKGKESKYIRDLLKKAKKPVIIAIKYRLIDTEGKQHIKYVQKVHQPDIRPQESIDNLMALIERLMDAYDVESFTIEDISMTEI